MEKSHRLSEILSLLAFNGEGPEIVLNAADTWIMYRYIQELQRITIPSAITLARTRLDE